jgi:peptidoglycan/LPS O-acetylase OafA/YrhL
MTDPTNIEPSNGASMCKKSDCRFFTRIWAAFAGGITGVAVCAALLMISSGMGEGWQILIAIPLFVLPPLTGGMVSGFMLSRYYPSASPKAHLGQLIIYSPAIFLILAIIIIQIVKDHGDFSFFSLIIIMVFSWIGSLLGWRLQAYHSKATLNEPPRQVH